VDLYRGVNPGGWGHDPPDFGVGRVVGVAGVCGRVWENTISYFGLKVCWKVTIFHKKFGKNVG